jgi:hypothetical protein
MAEQQSQWSGGGLSPDSNADNPQHTGLTTVMDAVEGVHFPVAKDKLIEERGDAVINLTGDHPETLQVLLLRTDTNEFYSVTDLVEQLEHVV